MKNMIAGVCALLLLSTCAAPTAPAGGVSTSQVKVDNEGSTGSNIKKRPKKAAEVVSANTSNHHA